MKYYICNKIVGLLGFTCKCSENYFCSKHRFPFLHNCKYDYKTEYINKLIKENPKIICEKINKF